MDDTQSISDGSTNDIITVPDTGSNETIIEYLPSNTTSVDMQGSESN